jgi:hypothetical protein
MVNWGKLAVNIRAKLDVSIQAKLVLNIRAKQVSKQAKLVLNIRVKRVNKLVISKLVVKRLVIVQLMADKCYFYIKIYLLMDKLSLNGVIFNPLLKTINWNIFSELFLSDLRNIFCLVLNCIIISNYTLTRDLNNLSLFFIIHVGSLIRDISKKI